MPSPDGPMLRPGLAVYRRDDAHLQVGIDEPRVVLRDTDGIRSLLRGLELGEDLGSLSPDAGVALARLTEAGLLVRRSQVLAAARDRTGAAAASLAAHGPEAVERAAAREASRVAVHAPRPWFAVAVERLAGARLCLAHPDRHPAVTLVVTVGEPARSLLDSLVRDDQPHLLVTLYADRARIGPFVAPGRTACLRCVDAQLAETDPRRPVVLEQLEASASSVPCDPVLAHAGVALGVREVAAYVEGDRPATWSATHVLSAALGQPLRTWPRHPHCGCSWG